MHIYSDIRRYLLCRVLACILSAKINNRNRVAQFSHVRSIKRSIINARCNQDEKVKSRKPSAIYPDISITLFVEFQNRARMTEEITRVNLVNNDNAFLFDNKINCLFTDAISQFCGETIRSNLIVSVQRESILSYPLQVRDYVLRILKLRDYLVNLSKVNFR